MTLFSLEDRSEASGLWLRVGWLDGQSRSGLHGKDKKQCLNSYRYRTNETNKKLIH